MHRVFWHIDALDFDIYSYGFMIMLGFMLAIWVAGRRSRVVGVDPFFCIDLTVFLLLAGVGGARLMFVLHYWDRIWLPDRAMTENLVSVVNIRDGGLEFYGGLIAAALVGVPYIRKRKIPLVPFLDVCFPVVALGLAFGRIGCFMNGCCYGKTVITNSGFWKWLSIRYAQFNADSMESIPYQAHLQEGLVPRLGEPGFVEPSWEVLARHVERGMVPEHYHVGDHVSFLTAPLIPSQLLSSAASIAVFLLLAWLWSRAYDPRRHRPPLATTRRRPRYGEISALFGICYAINRFGLELLRQDTDPVVLAGVSILGKQGLTISQVISVLILSVSVPSLVLLRMGVIGRPIEPLPEEPAASG